MEVESTIGIPLPSVDYSQVAVKATVSGDSETIEDKVLDRMTDRLQARLATLTEETLVGIVTDKRYARLVASIPSGDIDKLQVELSEKYDKALDNAKSEIIKLKQVLKDNGVSY